MLSPSLLKFNTSLKHSDVLNKICDHGCIINNKFYLNNEIDMDNLIRNVELKEDFIEKYAGNYWYNVFYFQKDLSEAFIRKQLKLNPQLCVHLDVIFMIQKVSESFIEEYAETSTHWDMIFSHQEHLSEDFIIKHTREKDWPSILYFQKNLSEDFLEKYLDRVDIYYILSFQKHLSERFIEKHANTEAHWETVFRFQKNLSEKFLKRHGNKNILNT